MKTKYFGEIHEMYQFIEENKVKMVKYNFTFAYGYQLIYEEQ